MLILILMENPLSPRHVRTHCWESLLYSERHTSIWVFYDVDKNINSIPNMMTNIFLYLKSFTPFPIFSADRRLFDRPEIEIIYFLLTTRYTRSPPTVCNALTAQGEKFKSDLMKSEWDLVKLIISIIDDKECAITSTFQSSVFSSRPHVPTHSPFLLHFSFSFISRRCVEFRLAIKINHRSALSYLLSTLMF